MAYYEMPVSLTPGQESGSDTIQIPFSASYVSVQNQTPATVQFATGQRQTPLLSGITIAPDKSYTGQMQSTQTITVYWTDANPMSSHGNEVIFGFSDQPIQMNVSESGAVTNVNVTGTVPITTTGSLDVNVQNATIPVSGIVTANIGGPVTIDSTQPINVAGTVQATIENSSLQVSGNVGITGGTMDVNLQGTPTFNLAAGTNVGISGGTIDINTGNVNVTNPVQTNALVKLGTTQFNVFDLGNGQSQSLLIAGITTGYFQTLVLEGTSLGGYTYIAAATAYNRNTSIGAATLTQSNGPNGEFYASGNLSAKQSFGNVQVGLTAQTSATATIFNDNMQAGTNWATKSGAVTYGASGANFTANGTLITETQTPQLAPQNLTVQASATLQNTSVTNTVNGANVGQVIPINSATLSASNHATGNNSSFASSVTPSADVSITEVDIYSSQAGLAITTKIWDDSGTVIASTAQTTVANEYTTGAFSSPVTLQGGKTYWIGFYGSGSCDLYSSPSQTTLTAGNVTMTLNNKLYYATGATFPKNGSTLYTSNNLSYSLKYQQPQPLDTSGGARPVALSNGWLVSMTGDSAQTIYLHVSKDNGQTWTLLAQSSPLGSNYTGLSLSSSGTKIYMLYGYGGYVGHTHFDVTTITTPYTFGVNVNVDSGQNNISPINDIKYNAVDGSLWATWSCITSPTYTNKNIRASHSTDGGNTWSTPVQLTTETSTNYAQNPCIDLVNGKPQIFFEQYEGSYYIGRVDYDGSNWQTNGGHGYTVYNGGTSYHQTNPKYVVDTAGNIHCFWSGTDATYTSNPQIKWSKSTDGGTTWTSPINVDPQTGISENSPTATIDQNGYLYVGYDVNRGISSANSYIVRTTDEGATWVRWMNIPYWSNLQMMYPCSLNVTIPLMIGMNSQTNYTQFWGKWTIGSHTMLGVEYWKDAQNYYLLQWSVGNLNLIKCVAGTVSTLTSAAVNETSQNVTLKLVVASNGNLTGTLSGANTNTVTGNDTGITLGSLGITGDNGVTVTNGFISGNYIPSDTVTVDVYAI